MEWSSQLVLLGNDIGTFFSYHLMHGALVLPLLFIGNTLVVSAMQNPLTPITFKLESIHHLANRTGRCRMRKRSAVRTYVHSLPKRHPCAFSFVLFLGAWKVEPATPEKSSFMAGVSESSIDFLINENHPIDVTLITKVVGIDLCFVEWIFRTQTHCSLDLEWWG
jgi:hypothetical protein